MRLWDPEGRTNPGPYPVEEDKSDNVFRIAYADGYGYGYGYGTAVVVVWLWSGYDLAMGYGDGLW